MRKLDPISRVIITFVCVAFALAALCSVVVADPAGAPPEKVKIGMLLTLSGKYASAGEDCRMGIEAGTAVAGGNSKLKLIYADSVNDPTASVSEFRKLASSDKVIAVYTHRSSIGMAVNPISLSTGIPLLGAVAHEDFARNNKYAIQVAWSTASEARFVANALTKRKYKRVAILSTEDEYTTAVAKNFRKEFESLGGSVVYDQSINPAETDFRSLLLQLKSKAVDAVYLDLLLPHIVPMVKQVHELGLGAALFGNFYIAKEEVREALGAKKLEGVEFVDLDNDLPALKAHLTGGHPADPA